MSSFVITLNGAAARAGSLISSCATFTNTGADDVTVETIAQATPSSGIVAFIDLATKAPGTVVPAGGTATVQFSVRMANSDSLIQTDVAFKAFFDDGTALASNTARVTSIPQASFLDSPTADGLLPVPGSLTFNSNTNTGLLGAV